MNRFKAELRKHGVELEHDYSYLPYDVGSGVCLESAIVDAEKLSVTYYYNVLCVTDYYDNSFNIINQKCN